MTESTERVPLHGIERSILGTLSKLGGLEFVDLVDLAKTSGLSIDQVRRGVEWLKAKQFVEAEEMEITSYSLGVEGKTAAKEGLPERKLVKAVSAAGGTAHIGSISKALGPEFAVALGSAKKRGWVKVEGSNISLRANYVGEEPEELVLSKLVTSESIVRADLNESELETIGALMRRHEGFIQTINEKSVKIKLTPSGRNIARTIAENEIDYITPRLLQTGEWKTRRLRALDVTSPSPKIFPGRKHPMRMFMDEVRETFVSLAFEEIFGPLSQSALWNFDALFIPQEHSAREMQDTFYVSNMRANISPFREQIRAIKEAHESGANTGSSGWGYKWREDESARVVLRTHTTAVTISYLAKYKPEEARVFTVGRVFRNEKSNYKHNPEFYQIEGVMVGEKLNLRNLIYILSKFYSKLGFNEIKFWPTYFPYTEPSLQTMAFLKTNQRWMELGGMGIFRPEVTIPLGVKNPVLAWGLSLDRLVMLRYGVGDIRQLFGANLSWLRSVQVTKV